MRREINDALRRVGGAVADDFDSWADDDDWDDLWDWDDSWGDNGNDISDFDYY